MSRYTNVKDGNFPDKLIKGRIIIKEKVKVNEHNDFLPYISYMTYGDSQLWHLIALANNIINPFLEINGKILAIPVEDFGKEI